MGKLRAPFGKHKLNLNTAAPSILAWGGLFLLVVPALLFFLSRVSFVPGIWQAIAVSIALGLGICTFLCVLILVELAQDLWLNRFYDKHRNVKIKISDADFECQNCGNRQVRAEDRSCSICGQRFQEVMVEKQDG